MDGKKKAQYINVKHMVKKLRGFYEDILFRLIILPLWLLLVS